MIQGFKEFILRGNVIDLAVAVVIGAAFAALVDAVVSTIIDPIISLFWQADANGNIGIPVQGLHGEVIFPVGNLINAIITFLAVAIVVYFVFVVPMNKWKDIQAAKAGVVDEELPTEQELLIQIRDLLEQQRGTTAAGTAATPPITKP